MSLYVCGVDEKCCILLGKPYKCFHLLCMYVFITHTHAYNAYNNNTLNDHLIWNEKKNNKTGYPFY